METVNLSGCYKPEIRSSKMLEVNLGIVLDESLIHISVHASQESLRFYLVKVHGNFLFNLPFSRPLLTRRVNHSEKLVES